MKHFLFFFMLFFSLPAFSQNKDFTVLNLSLPAEIADPNNQFSGLYIHDDKLFLLSESRLQDNAEAKLYAISLSDLENKMGDSGFILPVQKYLIYNLEFLRKKMKNKGDEYEGLEAMIIKDNNIYFSVETTTPSDNCYLIQGKINDSSIILSKKVLTAMSKPETAEGTHVYNAGFEALAILQKNKCAAFFEFNYFTNFNYVRLKKLPLTKKWRDHSIFTEPLPFRITDITGTGENKFTALNFFYKGTGKDEIYRVPAGDENEKLIKDSAGYQNYSRLVNITYEKMQFQWEPAWEFPKEYSGYNWEGIAAYRNGYFIINDKYTPERPYKTVLLYLKPKRN